MTIANIKDLPILSVRFTGRDATVLKVVLINKETNQEIVSTNSEDWDESQGVLHFDLSNYPDFLDDVKESTSISILMYGGGDVPVYKDSVRFFSTIDTSVNHFHKEGGTEYIFLDNE